jgi:hypothetical protein
MNSLQNLLLKSWIIKTSLFVLAFIALLSHSLLFFYGMDIYSSKLQPFLGELFVAILLIQYLLTKKCWYSWVAVFLLFINNFINLIYITTALPESNYKSALLLFNYFIAFLLSICYIFKKEIEPSANKHKIGGGVAIGKKPTHIRELINNKIVFIDLTVENLIQYEVFDMNSVLSSHSEPTNLQDYESILTQITDQVNLL